MSPRVSPCPAARPCLEIGVQDFLCPTASPTSLSSLQLPPPPFHSSLLGSVHHAWAAEARAGLCFGL